MSAEREELAALLFEHREDAHVCYDHPEAYCCACGEHEVGGYRVHLADVLAARDRRVAAEALRAAAELMPFGYTHAAAILRKRADSTDPLTPGLQSGARAPLPGAGVHPHASAPGSSDEGASE